MSKKTGQIKAKPKSATKRHEEEIKWTLSAAAVGMLAGVIARHSVHQTWRVLRDEDPPLNPDDPDTDWTSALIYTCAVGLAVGVARLMARRGASAMWRRLKHESTPKTKSDA